MEAVSASQPDPEPEQDAEQEAEHEYQLDQDDEDEEVVFNIAKFVSKKGPNVSNCLSWNNLQSCPIYRKNNL